MAINDISEEQKRKNWAEIREMSEDYRYISDQFINYNFELKIEKWAITLMKIFFIAMNELQMHSFDTNRKTDPGFEKIRTISIPNIKYLVNELSNVPEELKNIILDACKGIHYCTVNCKALDGRYSDGRKGQISNCAYKISRTSREYIENNSKYGCDGSWVEVRTIYKDLVSKEHEKLIGY